MVAIQPDAAAIVQGLAERQRLQRLLEAFRDVTHRALRGPGGADARDLLAGWGFPREAMDGLDLGVVPGPDAATGLAALGAQAGLADDAHAGRLIGPWRNPHGRILTFFACDPGGACAAERYSYAPRGRPATLFGECGPRSHLLVVEGLLDCLLAGCLGIPDVVGISGPFDWLTPSRLRALSDHGVRELTLLPPDTEAGRLGVLTVLDYATRLPGSTLTVLVADPNLTVGSRTVGELVRRRGVEGLHGAVSGRVDGDMYKLMMAPFGACT